MTNFNGLRWLRQLVLAISCLLLVIACNNSSPNSTTAGGSPSGGSTSPKEASKTLKVATDPTFAPFEFQSGSGQQTQGFDIDVINGISKAAGFQLKLENTRFDGIIPALQTSNVDAAISGMTITADRLKVVAFSKPYIKAGLAIAVQENNKDITSTARRK